MRNAVRTMRAAKLDCQMPAANSAGAKIGYRRLVSDEVATRRVVPSQNLNGTSHAKIV